MGLQQAVAWGDESNDWSEGFPNGIFHSCALWARGLARWESCRRVVVAAVVGVTLKSPGNITLTVLVFGPESVSYERSRRETTAKINHFPARIFFVKIPQSQNPMIYTILRFFGFWVLGLGFGIGFWDWDWVIWDIGLGLGLWDISLGLGLGI